MRATFVDNPAAALLCELASADNEIAVESDAELVDEEANVAASATDVDSAAAA